MKNSDLSIVLNSADNEVKAIADIVIPSEQPDELIKIIKKIFYARDYKKTLLKLKNRYQTKI
jgi:hydroxymethylpyrimidine pyrophosphatase-like HAD family hydrolase